MLRFFIGILLDYLLDILLDYLLGMLLRYLLGISFDYLLGILLDYLLGILLDYLLGILLDYLLGILLDYLLGILLDYLLGIRYKQLQSEMNKYRLCIHWKMNFLITIKYLTHSSHLMWRLQQEKGNLTNARFDYLELCPFWILCWIGLCDLYWFEI